MSDENILDISKFKKQKETGIISDEATSEVFEKETAQRIQEELDNPDKSTIYTQYKDGAAQMVLDMLCQDVYNWENNTGKKLCSYDIKDIFVKAIMEIEMIEFDHLSQMEEGEKVDEIQTGEIDKNGQDTDSRPKTDNTDTEK